MKQKGSVLVECIRSEDSKSQFIEQKKMMSHAAIIVYHKYTFYDMTVQF